MLKRLLRILLVVVFVLVALIVLAAVALWRLPDPGPREPSAAAPAPTTAGAPPSPQVPPPAAAPAIAGDCAAPSALAAAATDNGLSLAAREWAPWGRPELGWEIYLPLIAREIGSSCDPASPGFAAALQRWQGAQRLNADGVMSPETFEAMRVVWLRRRPFVTAMAKGVCPPGADEASLEPARPEEGYASKPVRLRPAALAAYRAMLAAARADVPAVAEDRQLLTIFSAYRSPADDEAHCDRTGACGTVSRARCSAHRTGLTVDLYLGAAPGSRPESTEDVNRLFQTRSAAYRWLVSNGDRFGFVNYPFEPWHWEWTGEPIRSTP